MIAAIFTIKSWTPPFQMHLRWRVVNARKNHPSCLISPGPTQGLARYILGTRNIMYTTKLASIRHLHRHHLCHQGKNMPRWIVSGCKIAFLMSLLADFPWARSRISALQGEGCFFTHIILSARVVRLSFSILGKIMSKVEGNASLNGPSGLRYVLLHNRKFPKVQSNSFVAHPMGR